MPPKGKGKKGGKKDDDDEFWYVFPFFFSLAFPLPLTFSLLSFPVVWFIDRWFVGSVGRKRENLRARRM